MTPAVFWILIGFICLLIGTLIIYWGTRRHDGKEPDSRPVNIPAPSKLELAVMENSNLTYAKWRALSPAKQSVHVERYFTSRGL